MQSLMSPLYSRTERAVPDRTGRAGPTGGPARAASASAAAAAGAGARQKGGWQALALAGV